MRDGPYPLDLTRIPMQISTGCPKLLGEIFLPPPCMRPLHEVRVITEGRAVALCCDAVEGRADPNRAQTLVETLWRDQPTDTVEDRVVWYAMGKVVGALLPAPSTMEAGRDLDDRGLFLDTAQAWMTWASEGGGHLSWSDRKEGASVLQHLSVANWASAVEALLREDLSEAKRYYRRALEVGGQFGTESNSVITWTYAASFFHLGR